MAQNYNINSSFGFNVMPRNAGASGQNAEADLFETASVQESNNFFDKYEKVFNGDVENEINLYYRQMMIVGMNLKASDNTIRSFDMKI